jgi:Domain of unknown function (DUF4180)
VLASGDVQKQRGYHRNNDLEDTPKSTQDRLLDVLLEPRVFFYAVLLSDSTHFTEQEPMNNDSTILEAARLGIRISSMSDISDLIGATYGADGLILTESDLEPEFFDLSTGLAGELFQKLTNYQLRTALVILEPAAHGVRFAELAFEHRTHNLIRFCSSETQALEWLNRTRTNS